MWTLLFITLLIIYALISVVLTLVGVAFYTLAERKIMASIQRRKGPNLVGIWGLLQPVADGLKLIIKNKINPKMANFYLFNAAPVLILTWSLVSWFFVPLWSVGSFIFFKDAVEDLSHLWLQNNFKNVWLQNVSWKIYRGIKAVKFLGISYISVGLLFLLAVSSFNVYGIILAGWSSNSKYAFLGSLRSAAQMISYEVAIGLAILPALIVTGNLINLHDVTLKYYLLNSTKTFYFLYPSYVIFLISMLAETNRTPFDLTEAEAELVAGYNVEYSSITFAMFFLAEYSNMLLMSSVIVLLFKNSENLYVFVKQILVYVIFFVNVRAAFPRYKYNQLMDLGWKVFLPIGLSFFLFVAGILIYFDAQLISN